MYIQIMGVTQIALVEGKVIDSYPRHALENANGNLLKKDEGIERITSSEEMEMRVAYIHWNIQFNGLRNNERKTPMANGCSTNPLTILNKSCSCK